MGDTNSKYIKLILFHVLIGLAIFWVPFLAKIYAALIFIGGLVWVIKTKNKSNEVLMVGAYIVGSEVFLRMTHGSPLYEFSKYSVTIFSVIGIFFSGFSKNSIPYWTFLILLIPGILIATETLNFTTDIRKTIAFNISGPVCLGLTALYTYNRNIKFSQMNAVFLSAGLPIVTTAMYLILYTPDLSEALTGTSSNFQTSGGFGPNQVATVLGLGMFVFFSRLIFASPNKLLTIINAILLFNISYRGLVTFSRGGMITGFIMIIVLIFILYRSTKNSGKIKLNYLVVLFSVALLSTWAYTSSQTGGLIEKRYSNEDALGRKKENLMTGRENISLHEIDLFLENPFFGIGVAKGAEIRYEESGQIQLSHNEITRMMAEHGALGILALLILLLTPMVMYLNNKQNIFVFCCLVFWLLTINHAAMRIAAPAFIYALSLLKIQMDETPAIHRK